MPQTLGLRGAERLFGFRGPPVRAGIGDCRVAVADEAVWLLLAPGPR